MKTGENLNAAENATVGSGDIMRKIFMLRGLFLFAAALTVFSSCNKSEDTAVSETASLQTESSVSDSSVSLTEQSEKTTVQSSAEASGQTETEYWSAEETRNTHFYGNDLKPEESSALQTGHTKASDKLSETEAEQYNFDEIENMSDEELIGLADIFSFGGNYSADFLLRITLYPPTGIISELCISPRERILTNIAAKKATTRCTVIIMKKNTKKEYAKIV